MGIIGIQLQKLRFGIDQMTLKDNVVVGVDAEEPEKAKAGSGEPKTTEATRVNKNGHPVLAVMEAELEKMEEQSGKANAGNEG